MPYPTPSTTAQYLEDGAAAVTTSRYGAYGGSPRVFDTGAGPVLWNGVMIAEFSAMDTSSGNENYNLRVEASNNSDFSGTVVELLSVTLQAIPTNDQEAYFINNQVDSVTYRYMRAQIVANGTTPSVTVDLWVIPLDDLDELSQAQLTKFMAIAATRFGESTMGFRAWAGGVVDGGPNSDGEYPLADGAGEVYLVPCPAKIAASAGMSYEAFIALTEHTTAFDGSVTGPDIMISTASALKRGKLFLFAARRTRDLAEFAGLLSEELLPSYNASTGLERKIAVGEIMRQTLGMVSALRYGVVNDCFSIRAALSMDSGDDVVESNVPVFVAGDVKSPAKKIQVGGAGGSGAALQSTIVEYIDSTHVRVAHNASATVSGQDGNWGTLNTAAMQDALDDCFNPYGVYNYGSILLLPERGVLTGALKYHPRTGLLGAGTRQSVLVRYGDAYNCPGGGAWARFDGDTDPYPITKYLDDTYYYPVYPNRYVTPSYYGDFVPDIAPTLCNAIGIDKNGDTTSLEGTSGGPSYYGQLVDSDFNVFNDFSLDGSRYCATRLYGGLEIRGGLFRSGVAPYHQVDPYPRVRGVEIYLHGWIGLMTFGQCSGNFDDVNLMNNGACGWHQRAFDCNIKGGTIIANAGPGLISAGANTNYTTMKVSFNGIGEFNWLWGSDVGRCNLAALAGGDNWNNLRVQESFGANLVVNGKGNDFTGCHFDDTGCIGPAHSYGTPTWITPAILVGKDGDDLRLNDVGVGGLVHVATNYASHAIYWKDDSGMGENTSGRLYTKGISTWYAGAGTSGDEAPNEWGADGGSVPSGTNLTLNGTDISTL
jgi:hypothetical protein